MNQQDFYAAFSQVNDFYASPDGLQRPGGMVIDGHCDVEAMGQWGWQLSQGVSLENVILQIKQSDEYRRKHPLPPFPPAPSRDALGTILIPFQGFTSTRTSYGAFPMFGPETTSLADADLDGYCADILATGMTHGEIAASWQYNEPGFLMPVPGADLSQNTPELCRRIRRMITNGLTGVVLFMAGDGRSRPKNPDGSYPYNDPVGHTYGFEWLMDNAQRIWGAVMAEGLHRHVVPCPGYDGVFYGWGGDTDGVDRQPQRVAQFGALMRGIDPGVLLAIEHGTGTIPTGGGARDWQPGGTMHDYDILLSEFSTNVHQDSTWQVVGRCVPSYVRPSDQPASDDPRPPFYLIDSVRGRRYYCRYEYRTVDWTKGRCDRAAVQRDRAYLQSLAPGPVC